MRTMDIQETFDTAATELCRRVGLPYPPPSGKTYGVNDAEWTAEEEADFKAWLIDYLKTVPAFKRMGMRYVKKEADWFMFQFGWRTKE